MEALHQLARRAGIPIPETDPKKSSRDEKLRAANRKALDFYQRALRSEAGHRARGYLEKRGLTRDTITEHGLGFAPDRWDGLTTTLEKSGIDRATLVEAGLAREAKRGGHHDFFRNRLIVPIFDSQGRAAGFAGRSLDGSEPKYINSPDSPIYRKRSVLYGLHRARSTIRRERSAILFEGYFDCLSAWQAGVAGAVAVCGTALTPDHAKLLSAQTRDVVLAFDADAGGRRATLRSLPILLEAQLRVRVAPLSGGRDPDDVIREDGADAFREAIRKAPAFVEFLVEEAREPARAGGGRAAAARQVLEVIARAPSPLDREEWLTEAAGSLGFSLESARQEMAQLRSRPSPGSTGNESARSPADPAPAPASGPPSRATHTGRAGPDPLGGRTARQGRRAPPGGGPRGARGVRQLVHPAGPEAGGGRWRRPARGPATRIGRRDFGSAAPPDRDPDGAGRPQHGETEPGRMPRRPADPEPAAEAAGPAGNRPRRRGGIARRPRGTAADQRGDRPAPARFALSRPRRLTSARGLRVPAHARVPGCCLASPGRQQNGLNAGPIRTCPPLLSVPAGNCLFGEFAESVCTRARRSE